MGGDSTPPFRGRNLHVGSIVGILLFGAIVINSNHAAFRKDVAGQPADKVDNQNYNSVERLV